MATTTKTQGASHRTHTLEEMPFNSIERPGCYLFVDTGDLIRMPPEALLTGHSPLITITSVDESRVARLSDNPSTPISALRIIAADHDFAVNF